MVKNNKVSQMVSNSLIIILSCIIISILLYFIASKALTKHVESSLIEIAKQGAKIVNKEIENKLSVLETLAKIETVYNTDISISQKLEVLHKDFKTEEFLRISIADKKGASYTTDGKYLYIGDRDYFQKAISGHRNISDPIVSRIDGSLAVIFAVPVFYDSQVAYVLYATYPAEALSLITDGIRMGEDGNSFILNREGTTIAHDNWELVNSKDNDLENIMNDPSLSALVGLEKQMIQGKSGAGEYVYSGIKKYMGFAPIEGTEWSFATAAPKKTVFKSINQILFFTLLSIIIVVCIILVMNFYLRYLRIRLNAEMIISQNAVDTSKMMIILLCRDGRIIEFNRYAEEKIGYEAEEIINKKTIYDLINQEYVFPIKQLLQNMKKGTLDRNIEFSLIDKQGQNVYAVWNINTSNYRRVKDNIEIMGIDISERVIAEKKLLEKHEELTTIYEELAASEEELKSQNEMLSKNEEEFRKYAFFDLLTGLPNRVSLIREFEYAIKKECKAALLFMDLDNFKLINDSYGHNFGDLLLFEVGNRIISIKNYQYFTSRLGGDEYAILLMGIENREEIVGFCNVLACTLNPSYIIDGIYLQVSFSIGIAFYPEDGKDIGELLKHADTAMYSAKEAGKNQYMFFNRQMNEDAVEKMTLQNHLRSALENDDFILYYQPQYEIKGNKIVGFEALIRWNSPELGMVPPIKFISIAEDTHIIIPLGEWILRTACKFIKKINDENNKQYTISVNISILQLLQDDFVDVVLSILREVGLKPSLLELELTESILMQSFDVVVDKLERLKQERVKIALDDFGKGYSSLSYLNQLPITTLKIDKCFIDSIEKTGKNKNLIGSIVYIGKKMGLAVVAEGVETENQLKYLVKHKCDIIQGYLFSKPVPEAEINGLIYKDCAIDI